MPDAVIVSTARTPIGKAYRGAFNMTHGADLGGHVVRHAVERAGVEPGEVEDVILGCALPERATGQNIARQAARAVLRLAPRFADSNALDRLDFAVREQLPGAGLGGLKALAEGPGSEALAHKLDALGEIEEWRLFALTPKNWAARLRLLRNLFRPSKPDPQAGAGRAA